MADLVCILVYGVIYACNNPGQKTHPKSVLDLLILE